MSLIESLALGIIQGITEFFPISSSGHLVVIEKIMNLPMKEMLSFDIYVHFGSLLAILIYFRKDIFQIIIDFLYLIRHFSYKNMKNNQMLYLIIATIPAVIVGLILKPYFGETFRSETLVGGMMIVTALYFVITEKLKKKSTELTIKHSLLIGIAQAFAILPGVSRSGMTISTGVYMGLDKEKAARFSFLMGSIVILGATVLSLADLSKTALLVNYSMVIVGVLSSFVASLFAIHFLLQIVKKRSLIVFSLYLVIVGSIILSGII